MPEDETGVVVKEEDGARTRGEDSAAFGQEVFPLERRARIGAALATPLTRRDVLTRPGPGGTKLTYLEGWRAVDKANRYNGWSSKVSSVRTEFVDEVAPGRYTACCSATVLVTLRDGSHHEDVGTGSAEGLRSKADAIGKARKEAVTDARKRALKNFGNALGNSLYDREHLKTLAKSASNSRNATPSNSKSSRPHTAYATTAASALNRPPTPHRPLAPPSAPRPVPKRENAELPKMRPLTNDQKPNHLFEDPPPPVQKPLPRPDAVVLGPVSDSRLNAELLAAEMADIQGLDFGDDF